LFQPVQYGTKPEGRLAAIGNAVGQRPPTSFPPTGTLVSTISQAGQTRGRSPVTALTPTPTSHGKIFGKCVSNDGVSTVFRTPGYQYIV
ncbi:hypothetical protein XENOCAPTIV_017063, partial [Xenoophorus captivus]